MYTKSIYIYFRKTHWVIPHWRRFFRESESKKAGQEVLKPASSQMARGGVARARFRKRPCFARAVPKLAVASVRHKKRQVLIPLGRGEYFKLLLSSWVPTSARMTKENKSTHQRRVLRITKAFLTFFLSV